MSEGLPLSVSLRIHGMFIESTYSFTYSFIQSERKIPSKHRAKLVALLINNRHLCNLFKV